MMHGTHNVKLMASALVSRAHLAFSTSIYSAKINAKNVYVISILKALP